jgi:pimeloyl-ACP methyl ester carboxylesterase
VVFLVHLVAALDNWDPRVVDGLAAKHHVITFDNRGNGASSGVPATSIEQVAKDAITFIEAMGFESVDLFGFSMGGMIAQEIVLDGAATCTQDAIPIAWCQARTRTIWRGVFRIATSSSIPIPDTARCSSSTPISSPGRSNSLHDKYSSVRVHDRRAKWRSVLCQNCVTYPPKPRSNADT